MPLLRKKSSMTLGSVSKKPAADTGAIMKKPAGKLASLDQLEDIESRIVLAKRPAGAIDDDDDDDDRGGTDDDRNEWKRMKRFFDNHEDDFPDHVKDVVDVAHKKKTGSRGAVRRIVEEAVEKQSNGKFKLCIKKPFFEEIHTKYFDKSGDDRQVAMTKTFMVQSCGGIAAFKEALDANEITEFVEDGKTWYRKCEQVISKKSGSREAKSIKGSQEITPEIAKEAHRNKIKKQKNNNQQTKTEKQYTCTKHVYNC